MTTPAKKYFSKEDALKRMQKYCAMQDRCHQEVRYKLIEIGIYGEALEEIIASLITESFLNEERFARSFARGKFRIKKWGRLKIASDLRKREISDYCIRKSMEEIEEEDYLLTLKTLLEKKREETKEKNLFAVRQKLLQYARAKGYETPLVKETLEHLL